MQGQISIFDILDPGKDDFETMPIERAAEIVGKELGVKFKLDESHFKGHYSAKIKGFYISIGFNVNYEGKRYLDTEVAYKKGGYGNPANSIDDCIQSIKSYMEKELARERQQEKPICKYSNHSCNKEVLHALAQESDPFCPKVCCRFCNTKYCGVRCNGSEEPKEPKKAAEHVEQKQDIVLLPDFAKGKGWISVQTIPKNLKWHIDVLGTYKYDNKECWSQCKGYYNSKDNQYVALDYPVDIPRAEWKFWRYRNSCINCTRYVKGTEQPPEGWGEVGWCNQHKQKVGSAEIGYCQKHERLDFYEY